MILWVEWAVLLVWASSVMAEWSGLAFFPCLVFQVEGWDGWCLSPHGPSSPGCQPALVMWWLMDSQQQEKASPSTHTIRSLMVSHFLMSHWPKKVTSQSPGQRMEKSSLSSDGKICYVTWQGGGRCDKKCIWCLSQFLAQSSSYPWNSWVIRVGFVIHEKFLLSLC